MSRAVDGIPSANGVIRSRELSWQRFTGPGDRAWGYLVAADTSLFGPFNYRLAEGRYLNSEDMHTGAMVCMVGTRLAARLGCGESPIGARITVRSFPLTIVGVIDEGSVRSRRDSECIIPFSVYASRFENADRNLDAVAVSLESSDSVELARTALRSRYLEENRGVANFEIETSADKIREMRSTSAALKLVLWFIAGVTLLVGGISIMNIMFATIGNRIREIGIRKALGARRYDLFIQFVFEAVFVCFFGGIPGMVVGAAIQLSPPGVFPYEPRLTIMDFTVAFGFTLLAGLLSGLFPALRAANMQPVEALRY